MNCDDLIQDAKRTLVAANERFGYQGDEEEQAWDLLIHAAGKELDEDCEVTPRLQRRFQQLVRRRTSGEPMAYIVGWIDFADFRLNIKPGAFVPRLTSEFLAEQAIRRLRRRRNPVHVDVATGIGPVAIAAARGVPHAQVWGVDISPKALGLARANASRLEVPNVTFRKSDLFAGLTSRLRGQIDVVTIHPPYVPRAEVSNLPPEIKKFEPRQTLTDGSPDGLGLLSRAIQEGIDWLRPAGWLLIEITPSEFWNVRRLLTAAGYYAIRSTHGAMKFTRVIVARA